MQLSFLSVVLKVALPSPFKSWGLIKKEGYDSLIKVTLLCILEFVKECQLGLSYISLRGEEYSPYISYVGCVRAPEGMRYGQNFT